MRTIPTAALLLATALPSPALLAGEPVKDQAKVKAERITDVTKKIAAIDDAQASRREALAAAEKQKNAVEVERRRRLIASGEAERDALQLELRWLKGEVTAASAEAKVKAAQEVLDKAPEAEKARAQTAVDLAKKELVAVKTLDAKGEF